MIDLTNTTFIIPLRIEHIDRYNNAQCVLGYLNHHFKTNVFIYEVSDEGKTMLDFLPNLTNLNVHTIVEKYDGTFHRMRYLNTLLNYVETPVVCNYDIDVVLSPNAYVTGQSYILEGKYDLLFPYGFGEYQLQIQKTFTKQSFLSNFDLTAIPKQLTTPADSQFGHCMFFNTDSYKLGGAENENFISWGPEDKERPWRFDQLGYSVSWLENSYVWHFEHERGADSSKNNPYLQHNCQLFDKLVKFNPSELLDYYRSQDYLKHYDNFLYPQQKQSTLLKDLRSIN